MHRYFSALILVTVLAGCSQVRTARRDSSVKSAPLVVTIVIDQLAAWVMQERWSSLSPNGGFARLRRSGIYVDELRFAHSATETAAGHASLYTGVTPDVHGIEANEMLEPALDWARVGFISDAQTRVVKASGRSEQQSVSLARLRVESVADKFKKTYPDAFVVSLSYKDRGAVFGGGRKPAVTAWYSAEDDGFISSSAFGESLPAWFARFGTGLTTQYRDEQPTWPPAPAGKIRTTIWADFYVLEAARAALEERRDRPMLLALSLSANDYVGHLYGADSTQAADLFQKLDALLASFFQTLDKIAGPSGYAVVLAADHGITTRPEMKLSDRSWCGKPVADRWQRPCQTGGRLAGRKIADRLEQAARSALGTGNYIRGIVNGVLFLDPTVKKLDANQTAAFHSLMERALQAEEGIAQAYWFQGSSCPPLTDESIAALACRSGGRVGDALLVPKPGFFFEVDAAPADGLNHGTPYLYDRAVPLFVMARGRGTHGQRIARPLFFSTFTATVLDLLGVEPSAGLNGKESVFSQRGTP